MFIKYYEGYNAAPGTSTHFIVNRQFNDRLPEPFNQCFDDLSDINDFESIIYKEILRANLTYRQVDCFRLCLQKLAIETCNCYDATIYKIFDAEPCWQVQQINCLSIVYNNFRIDENCHSFW